MKKNILFICISLLLYACAQERQTSSPVDQIQAQTQRDTFAIVVHGGAGTILKENISDFMELAYITVIVNLIQNEYNILKNGESSIDSVEASIKILDN